VTQDELSGTSAEPSRQRTLDLGCRLASALLERFLLEGGAERVDTAWRRREALELFEELALPTAVFDIASRTTRFANAAWRALFGARGAYEAIPGVDGAGRTGRAVHIAELVLDLGGRPAYGAATLLASRDGDGEATCVVVVCEDITDEVIARELAVDADALVWSAPLAAEPDYYNRRWSAYSASRPGWQRAIHRDDLARCIHILAGVIRVQGSATLEARLHRADGEYRWHRIQLASTASRWFATAIDVHDAHEATAAHHELIAREADARAEAEEANRLKDQFLATVSHELRTPLTTMVLWEGVLGDEHAAPALRAKALEAIRQSVVVQSRVVGDLLDISRAISGKLHVDLRAVDVDQLVSEAVAAIAPVASAREVALDRQGSSAGSEVRGDAVRLRQVLDNLLTNAVKFTDPGGRVTVTVARRDRAIVIEVDDSGCGIAAEFLPRLFEPFSQIDDATTRAAGGLGLGLAIARRLVELHGGTLEASSRGPRRGATLTVTLPAVAATSTSPALVARTPRLDRMRVLVIDDDPRVCEALGLLLERAGAQVDTADSAATGRTRIARSAPDAIVCDIAMPVEDGYTFIRGLRGSGNTTAAIALTAHAAEVDVALALAAGFDRHLAKPIDINRLVASIAELVVARRATARSARPLVTREAARPRASTRSQARARPGSRRRVTSRPPR
jgi:signal transduction histidine kinase/DNA-binding NarL/FixJ family response regulator